MTLTEYLRQNGGELTWPDAKRSLCPCAGRSPTRTKRLSPPGICPDNILLDDQGRPWLWGLAIAAARMKGACPDLCPGYSAPEQYEENGWPGTFTDVYALAAVLYKMLTGTMPPEAPSRMVKTIWPQPATSTPVPESVSDAISAAMMLSPDFRMETVEELTAACWSRRTPTPQCLTAKGSKRLRSQNRLSLLPGGKDHVGADGCLVAILVVASSPWLGDVPRIVSLWRRALQPEVSSSQVDTTVPKFVGQYIEAVMTNAEYQSRFELRTTSRYDSSYPAGVVVEQSTPRGKDDPPWSDYLTVSAKVLRWWICRTLWEQAGFATKALSSRGSGTRCWKWWTIPWSLAWFPKPASCPASLWIKAKMWFPSTPKGGRGGGHGGHPMWRLFRCFPIGINEKPAALRALAVLEGFPLAAKRELHTIPRSTFPKP